MSSKSSAAGTVQRVRIKVEQPLDAGVHLLFLNEFAALACRDSFFDGRKEPNFVIEIAHQKSATNAFRSRSINSAFAGSVDYTTFKRIP